MLRLTKTVCFALEMAHASLQNPGNRKYKALGLNKIWDDIAYIKSDGRVVSFRIRVRDFRRVVYVKCITSIGRDGHRDGGECHINVRGSEAVSDMFFCVLMPTGEIRPYSGPRGLDWYGLDEDILADLKAADILMSVELERLTEEQVFKIFIYQAADRFLSKEANPDLPDRSDFPAYSERLAHDKLTRLRDKLEAKGVSLTGPRLELAAQL
jgi:hypothetical protein